MENVRLLLTLHLVCVEISFYSIGLIVYVLLLYILFFKKIDLIKRCLFWYSYQNHWGYQ